MKGAAGLPREEGAEAAGIKVDRALLQERERKKEPWAGFH